MLGPPGTITLTGTAGAADLVRLNQATISTIIAGGTSDPAVDVTPPANIRIEANTLSLENGTNIEADTQGDANAGIIAFEVTDLYSNLQVDAEGNLMLDGDGNPQPLAGAAPVTVSSSSTEGTGNPGRITVAQAIDEMGTIIQDAQGNPIATDTILLHDTEFETTTTDGGTLESRGNISLAAETLRLQNGTALRADTKGTGPAGNILLQADTLTLTNGVTVSSESMSKDVEAGAAGTITLTGTAGAADLVRLNQANISTTIAGGNSDTPPANIRMTADTLSLENGTRIEAGTEGDANAGTIAFEVTDLYSNLQVDAEGNLVLDGDGNPQPLAGAAPVTVSSSSTEGTGNPGRIVVAQAIDESGVINEAATTIRLNDTEFETTTTDGGTLESRGNISLAAETLRLQNGTALRADTKGTGPAGNILLQADTLTLTNGVTVSSESMSKDVEAGAAGTITLTGTAGAADLVRLNQANISTTIAGDNLDTPPANIRMTADTLSLENGTRIEADTEGDANAGTIAFEVMDLYSNLQVDAEGNLVLDGDGNPQPLAGAAPVTVSSSSTEGTGNPGRIVVAQAIDESGVINEAATTIRLNDTEFETTTTDGGTLESRGDISLAAETLRLQNRTALRADTKGTGPAGNILLQADTLTLTNEVTVSSESMSKDVEAGAAGTITLTGTAGAADLVRLNQANISTTIAGDNLDTPPANIRMTADTLSLENGTRIEADTEGDANAGTIAFEVTDLYSNLQVDAEGNLVLDGDGNPQPLAGAAPVTVSSSSTEGTGNPGRIVVAQAIDESGVINEAATTIRLNDTEFETTTTDGGTPENRGNISLAAEMLRIQNNSTISADTTGIGTGGNISIVVGSKLVLDSTRVSASTSGSGRGGNIAIKTTSNLNPEDPTFGNEQLLLTNGTVISAESTGTGDAGNITLETTDTLRIQDSQITTKSEKASGGEIKLLSTFLIDLIDSTIESSVQGSDNDTSGGNIFIDPDFVLLQRSRILANAVAGNGGNINIRAGVLLVDAFSTIDASSQFGVSGTISVDSPVQNLSGAIAPLPEEIVEVADLFSARCAAQKGGAFSSFTLSGRDTLPAQPGDFILTPLQLDGIEPANFDGAFHAPTITPLELGLVSQHPLSQLAASRMLPMGRMLAIFDSGCRS